jgi:hypothetical protein
VLALVEANNAALRRWRPCNDECECQSCERREAIVDALAAVEKEIQP